MNIQAAFSYAYANKGSNRISEMIPLVIPILLVIGLLVGCQTKETSHEHKITSGASDTNNIAESKNTAPGSSTVNDDFDYSDCIRGQAESVTKKTVYPNAIFKRSADNHTGVETVELENGERLTINNWGCEYFVLTFRIESERFQADTSDTRYWLSKALILMSEIANGIDAPLNIEDGIEAISVYMASMDSRTYAFGEEIVFNDDVIRDFVTLDGVQRMNDKRFAVEISFAKGPL